MEKTTIVAIILGLLVLVSAVQAVQLNGLKEKVAEGQARASYSSSGAGAASSRSSGSTAALPSSIKDLPQMVGGC